MIIDPIFALIAKILIGGLFLFSGLQKLRSLSAFQSVLADYGVAKTLQLPASFIISVCEVVIALMVVNSFLNNSYAGMFGGLLLLMFYTGLLSFYYYKGKAIDCGCSFGSNPAPIGSWHVIRNLILISVGALSLLPQGERLVSWLDYSTAFFVVILIGLSLVIIENMKTNNNYFNVNGNHA